MLAVLAIEAGIHNAASANQKGDPTFGVESMFS
jgi:hypothetical protein